MDAWKDFVDDAMLWADVRVAPVYLLSAVLIGYVLFVLRRGEISPVRFVRWLMPRDVYLHPSHLVDIKLFVANRALSVLGAFNAAAVLTGAATLTVAALTSASFAELRSAPWSAADMTVATLVIALVSDFCVYWIHRLHHEVRFLWPFHAVHHSAEVLTPITLYRKHPVYDVISSQVRSAVVGVASGLVLVAISKDISLVSIGGANVVYVAFNFLGANLRHSHIWWRFGGILERIFISPAQHQIHHSRAPEYHMRNYGEIFALWDWMFGTLFVAGDKKDFEFGLNDADGARQVQPHGSFTRAMVVPFRESWAALSEAFGPRTGSAPAETRDG